MPAAHSTDLTINKQFIQQWRQKLADGRAAIKKNYFKRKSAATLLRDH
jgi:hypothetical protein